MIDDIHPLISAPSGDQKPQLMTPHQPRLPAILNEFVAQLQLSPGVTWVNPSCRESQLLLYQVQHVTGLSLLIPPEIHAEVES